MKLVRDNIPKIITEVIYALLDEMGVSKDEFEAQRLKKANHNGAFKDKVLLVKIK